MPVGCKDGLPYELGARAAGTGTALFLIGLLGLMARNYRAADALVCGRVSNIRIRMVTAKIG